MCSTTRRKNRACWRWFPAAFQLPTFASRASCPAWHSAPLTIGLPAPEVPDHDGVSMFRTCEMRPGPGALYTPGTAVPARSRMRPVTAACRLAATGPCHPGSTTRPGASLSRGISKGSLAFAPPGHFPRLWSPDGTGALGLYPGLHTRLSMAQPRMPERERAFRHWPGVTSPPSATSLDELTHHERPHVATHLQGVLSNQATEA